jgi:polyisoprenoid-binding protein YceI
MFQNVTEAVEVIVPRLIKKSAGRTVRVLGLFPAVAAAILIAPWAAPVTALSQAWQLDKAHSSVNFSVTHMVIAEVTGKFGDFELTFESAKPDFSDAKVGAVIKATSIDTDDDRRDNHLRSDDFFSVEKFPEITFTGKTFEKVGENQYKLNGDLTMRGVTKPVTMDVRYRGSILDNRGNTKAGFRATTTLDRFDFDVKWSAMLDTGSPVVSREVDVTINLELVKPKQQ